MAYWFDSKRCCHWLILVVVQECIGGGRCWPGRLVPSSVLILCIDDVLIWPRCVGSAFVKSSQSLELLQCYRQGTEGSVCVLRSSDEAFIQTKSS